MTDHNSYINFDNKVITKLKNIYLDLQQNKLFKYSLLALAIKTLLFIVLISDNMANGVDFKNLFFSVPPILVYLSFFLILLSFCFLFKGKFQLWSYSILNLLLTILYIADILYYRSNRKLLTFQLLSAVSSNMENLGDSILGLFRFVDILFLLDLILIIFLTIKEKKNLKKYKSNVCAFLLLLITPILYLNYAHIKVDKLKVSFINQTLFQKAWTDNQVVSNLTPIGFHCYDFIIYLENLKPYTIPDEEKAEAENWLKEKYENLPANEYKGIFKDKNLIVLQLESFENSIINRKINGNEITPNLNKLLKNSLYFDNFHEQTYMGNTADAELITNTSVLPIRDGVTFFQAPYNEYKYSLPNIFTNMGYSTTASHPDKAVYWNWQQSLRSIGYKLTNDEAFFDNSESIGLGLSDKAFLEQWVDVITTSPEPSLNYGVTLSCHTPFKLEEKYINFDLPAELANTDLGNYIQSAHYTDEQIGNLFDTLDKNGVLDNSVVVMYGDHEGVTKYFSDSLNQLDYDNNWFKNNNKKVPLIIYSKDLNGETISTIGGQVDTLPTLAYLFDQKAEEYSMNYIGRNLLNTNKNFAVLSNGSIICKDLNDEEMSKMLDSLSISNKLVKSNYFKEGIENNEK